MSTPASTPPTEIQLALANAHGIVVEVETNPQDENDKRYVYVVYCESQHRYERYYVFDTALKFAIKYAIYDPLTLLDQRVTFLEPMGDD